MKQLTNQDNDFLTCYLTGFIEELEGLPHRKLTGEMQRAYNIGRSDALGDVGSIDLQTEEYVLNRVKNKGGTGT